MELNVVMSRSNANKKWVIVKSSRLYKSGPGYKGPSWTIAGYQMQDVPEYFDMHSVAEMYAEILSSINPVGFHVEEYKEKIEGSDSTLS